MHAWGDASCVEERASAVNKKQLEKFRKILLKRRDILLEMRNRHRMATQQITADMPKDAEESLPLEELTGVISEQEGLEVRELEQIELALRRIEDRTYGVCTVCEEDISVRRLEALPYATLCVPCQEELEESVRHREDQAPRMRGTIQQMEDDRTEEEED